MTEHEWIDIFGSNLESMMAEYGWTQRELAEATGLTQATISNYIHKRRMPTIKAIINLSYVLGCDLYDLIDFGDRLD